MSLHVVIGVLVSVYEHEAVVIELRHRADVQVLSAVVLRQLGAERRLRLLLDASSLQELTADDT